MKILFLTTLSFRNYPCCKRALGMGESLSLLGNEVFIIALDCEGNRKRLLTEAPHCKTVMFSGGNALHEAIEKIRIIWALRPDLVYSLSYSPRNLAFLRWLLPWRMRFVVEFSELYSQYGDTTTWWKFVERYALVESSGIVCASQYIVERFQGLSQRAKILYSPYAYPSYLKKDATRQRMPESCPRVFFMAYLIRVYGVHDLIEACSRLLGSGLKFEVDIVGEGPEFESARDRIRELGYEGCIHLHGFLPEDSLNGLMSKADVFIAPLRKSIQDMARCPSKLYYYIPYDKPIVTCRFGEPFRALGEYGYYYEPEDAADMAKAIQRALEESPRFHYPDGFLKSHSWDARAMDFITWTK